MDAPRSRGQVMPIFLIALVPFLLLAALVVDVGSWRDSQRQLQSAADSAAVAAAAEIPSHDATAAAAKAAAADGVVDGSGGVTLTVNIPPRSGNYTSDTLAAEVIVKKIQTSYFAGLADQNGTTVKVRAVARLDNGGPCLLTLSSDHNSLDLVNGSITMPACAIADNGGLHINQASIDAASVTIVEHPLPDPKYFSKATPPPVSLPYTDQCAAIPGCAAIAAAPPSPSSCSTEPSHVAAANVTLDPGTYCGGLQINNSTVHLNPGLYYMEGDLSISNATVIGDGVTLYFASGGFKTANADIQLSAPATGFGAGVLLYQPASNSSDIRITNPSAGPGGCPTINAPADNPFYGAVYAPAAQINLTNGLWTPTATIASSVKMRNADWCYGNPGGSPILHPVLAE